MGHKLFIQMKNWS